MASKRHNQSQSERAPLLGNGPHGPAHARVTSQNSRVDDTASAAAAGTDTPKDALIDPQQLSKSTRNVILGVTWLGVLLGSLDTTIVASLVSSISSDFAASNQAGALGTSYLLTTACFTPLYARFSDIVGRRAASLLSFSMFTIGTAGCGLAPSMSWLIAARAVAGMGGGGLMSVSSIVASDLVPLKQRGLFQGIANIFYGVGSATGSFIGAVIAQYFGWRMAFLFQVPLLVAGLILVYAKVRYTVPGQGKSKREMASRIDYLGSLTLVLALGSLLFAMSYKNGENEPWSSPRVYGLSIASLVFGVAFVVIEAYWASEPVLPMSLFSQRNGLLVSISCFTLSFAVFSLLYNLPLYFEVVRGMTPAVSGAHLVPNSVSISIGSLFAGFVIRRTGKYYWLLVVTAAMPVSAFLMLAFLNDNTPSWLEWVCVIPSGLGFSSVLTGTLIALIASVDRSEMATATGLTYLARYTGQVIGVATSSSLLQSVLLGSLQRRISGPGSGKIIDKIRHVSTSIGDLPGPLQREARGAYHDALKAVFLLNAGMAFLCWLGMTGLQEFPLPATFAEEQEQRSRTAEGRNRDSSATV